VTEVEELRLALFDARYQLATEILKAHYTAEQAKVFMESPQRIVNWRRPFSMLESHQEWAELHAELQKLHDSVFV
jgi:hypothetical protein